MILLFAHSTAFESAQTTLRYHAIPTNFYQASCRSRGSTKPTQRLRLCKETPVENACALPILLEPYHLIVPFPADPVSLVDLNETIFVLCIVK